MGRTILNTKDVSELCNVSPRTVCKWFDSGKLRGYRIPGTQARRFMKDTVYQFMRDNDMEDKIPVASAEGEGV